MDRWIGIDEFVAVASNGSFSSAAAQLNTSVAQISRRVKMLEERLNIQLLTRTTRKLALTQEGEVFLSHAKHLQHGLDDATAAIRQRDRQPTGKLKLTAPVMYGESYVMPAVVDYMRLYPKVEIEMHLTNNQVDLLDKGFDLAIRLGKLQDSSLRAKRLTTRKTMVCGANTYLNQFGQPHTLSELSNHKCLIGNSSEWRFVEHGKTRQIKVSGSLRCNSGWGLLEAAKQGLGLVQLPHYYVQEALDSGELTEVLTNFRPEEEGVWALYPPRQFVATSLRLLLDHLSAHFNKF
ncbi:LysR substrate-binding domain-containing protein [Pseudoalteromonas piscicida]|uniref:LysR substrate-binding domain-containing protein n=1 Tax=Pseudoalteromonas piscicida TaxID=43662 RepID=UPI0030C947B7